METGPGSERGPLPLDRFPVELGSGIRHARDHVVTRFARYGLAHRMQRARRKAHRCRRIRLSLLLRGADVHRSLLHELTDDRRDLHEAATELAGHLADRAVAVDAGQRAERRPPERDGLGVEILVELEPDIEARHERLDCRPLPHDDLDGLGDRLDLDGLLRRPARRPVRLELEGTAREAEQVEAHVDQADLERVSTVYRARVVGRLATTEAAARDVEASLAFRPSHVEGSRLAGALDQTEDLGERERIERSLQTQSGLLQS